MNLTVTNKLIESDDTDHYAEHVGNGGWCVTWLPNRLLDRNQAITAMTIAEEVARALQSGRPESNVGLIASLARELDLLCVDAVQMVMDNHPE